METGFLTSPWSVSLEKRFEHFLFRVFLFFFIYSLPGLRDTFDNDNLCPPSALSGAIRLRRLHILRQVPCRVSAGDTKYLRHALLRRSRIPAFASEDAIQSRQPKGCRMFPAINIRACIYI